MEGGEVVVIGLARSGIAAASFLARQGAREAGVPVIAEIELAFRHLDGRIAAVTGTKGKSTTTAALGAMLREAGFDARGGGNIGSPLIGLVENSTGTPPFAVEASS